jgi:hypothetical protein
MADIFDTIDKLEQEHRFLEAVGRLRGEFVEAEEEKRMRLDNRREELEEERYQYAEGLIEWVKDELGEDAPNFSKVEGRLAELDEQVWPDHPSLPGLREEIEKRRAEVARKQTLDELEAELQAKKDVPWVLTHDKLLKKARRIAADYAESVRAQELLQQAKEVRESAYDREGKITTAAMTDEWQPLITQMKKDLKSGKEELPWYELKTIPREDGGVKRVLESKEFRTAREAYDHVLDLAHQAAEDKADEKIEGAEREIQSHPGTAVSILEEVLRKEGELYEGLYQHLSDSKRDEVEQMLERAREAQAERERVETALARIRGGQPSDPRLAWEKVEKLAEEEPFAPTLEETRDSVRTRLKGRLRSELNILEDRRRQGETAEAREEAQQVREWAERAELITIVEDANDLIECCNQDEELAMACQRISDLIGNDELEEARDALDVLLERGYVQERKAEFGRIDELESRWQARKNLEKFIRDTEDELSSHDDAELKSLKEACGEELDRRGEEPRLERLIERIEARQAFLAAKEAMERQHWGTARRKYQEVMDLEGDDAGKAEELKKDAIAGEEERNKVTRAIKQAQRALEAEFDHYYEAEKAYRATLKALKDCENTRDERWGQIYDLTRQVEARWEGAVTDELKQVWDRPEKDRPMAEIERLILEVLDEELRLHKIAQSWKNRALPLVYKVRAEAAHKRHDREGALDFIDKALEHVSWEAEDQLTDLQAFRRRIYKKKVYREVELLDDADKIEKLVKWAQEPEAEADIESRLWLVELWLNQENIEKARIYLHAVRRRLERDEDLQSKWDSRVQKLTKRLAADEDVMHTKHDIIKGFGLPRDARELTDSTDWGLDDKYPRQLKAVCEDYEELRRREGNRRAELVGEGDATLYQRALENWYEEQWSTTLSALTDSLAQYQEDAVEEATDQLGKFLSPEAPVEAIKARWNLALKIKVLNSYSKTAEPILDEPLNLWPSLCNRAKEEEKNNVGPRSKANGNLIPSDQALNEQIDTVHRIENRVAIIQEHLKWAKYVGQIGKIDKETDESTQENKVDLKPPNLSRWLEELQGLKQCIRIVPTHLSNVRKPVERDIVRVWREHIEQEVVQSDNTGRQQILEQLDDTVDNWYGRQVRYDTLWGEIDSALADIPTAFRNHRTVEWVKEEVKETKDNYRAVLALVGKLICNVYLEDFTQALNALDDLEDKAGEKGDAFGIWTELRVTDPYPDPIKCKLVELRDRLKQKKEQKGAVDEWMERAEPIVCWAEVSEEIVEQADQANYDDALSLCQDALQGLGSEGQTNNPVPNVSLKQAIEGVGSEKQANEWITSVSLEQAIEVLEDKPQKVKEAEENPLSRRVQEKLTEAERGLGVAQKGAEKAQKLSSVSSDDEVEWLIKAGYRPEWARQLPRAERSGIVAEWRDWDDFVREVNKAIKEYIPNAPTRKKYIFWGVRHKEELRRHWRESVEKRREEIAKEWDGWNELLGKIDAA